MCVTAWPSASPIHPVLFTHTVSHTYSQGINTLKARYKKHTDQGLKHSSIQNSLSLFLLHSHTHTDANHKHMNPMLCWQSVHTGIYIYTHTLVHTRTHTHTNKYTHSRHPIYRPYTVYTHTQRHSYTHTHSHTHRYTDKYVPSPTPFAKVISTFSW